MPKPIPLDAFVTATPSHLSPGLCRHEARVVGDFAVNGAAPPQRWRVGTAS